MRTEGAGRAENTLCKTRWGSAMGSCSAIYTQREAEGLSVRNTCATRLAAPQTGSRRAIRKAGRSPPVSGRFPSPARCPAGAAPLRLGPGPLPRRLHPLAPKQRWPRPFPPPGSSDWPARPSITRSPPLIGCCACGAGRWGGKAGETSLLVAAVAARSWGLEEPGRGAAGIEGL